MWLTEEQNPLKIKGVSKRSSVSSWNINMSVNRVSLQWLKNKLVKNKKDNQLDI